jgi:uncharacterized protein
LTSKKTLLVIAVLFIALCGKAYHDTNSIEIRSFEIRNSPLGSVLEGLKIAHLSDLHIKRIDKRLEKVLEVLHGENPDFIFITGDTISFKNSYEPALAFFGQLKASLGIYGVLGNTQYSNENESCILCQIEKSKDLQEMAVPRFLRNSSAEIMLMKKSLQIIGSDNSVDKKGGFAAAI